MVSSPSPLTRRQCLKAIVGTAVAAGAVCVCHEPLWALEDGPQLTPNEAQLAAMAEIAERFMSRNNVKALSVAIARHGQFVYRKAFGVADESGGEAATPSHLFRIASVSKPITAVAIFSLIEEGRLRLSDSVFGSNSVLGFDYGSKYRNRVQKITLENLLTHTSGGWENNNDDPIYLNPGFDQHQLIAWTLQNVPLKYDPGTHFLYSNFGYCILGRVIEKISGRAYEPYVQAEILKNFRMREHHLLDQKL
jgi:CubicO group peptidase (beta-lactamase class C family)